MDVTKVVITGAAGFIGSHLCERLLKLGCKVVGIDNFDEFYDPAVKRANIAECVSNPDFELIEADIRNAELMDKIIEGGCGAIIHLAARAGVRPSIEQPLLYSDVNINGTVTLLEAAAVNGVEKFIFASSSSVYGNNAKVPFSEDDCVDFPISPYAATKKAGELLCHTYHHLHGMDMTCLRFFTVYGPRQRPDLAIHKFAKLMTTGKTLPIYGDGTMSRDFTYVDDIIDGVISAIDNCDGYRIYNLGESEPVTVNQLVNEMESAFGIEATKEYLPVQPGDVERTYADVTRARNELGYRPSTTISEGLRKFAAWFNDNASK